MRGYKEEGTTSTPFDMVVMNDLDRFHLFGDVVDRLPQLGSRAAYAKQAINEKLLEHKQYIAKHGDDMPEITGWRWGQTSGDGPGGPPPKATTCEAPTMRPQSECLARAVWMRADSFSGTHDALFERHLLFDRVIDPATGRAARSLGGGRARAARFHLAALAQDRPDL